MWSKCRKTSSSGVSWKQSREPASRLSSSTQDSRWCRSNETSIGSKWSSNLLRKHGGKHGTIKGAASGGDIEAVKEFLAAGADVNAKNVDGWTPLHLATTKEVVELHRSNLVKLRKMHLQWEFDYVSFFFSSAELIPIV